MKNFIQNGITAIAAAIFLTGCNNDDSTITQAVGNGNLDVEFDNSYAGNDLVLNAAQTPTSNAEILKISAVRYIISNIVVTNAIGISYTYPKNDGYFIVDESNEESLVIHLNNIPAADYVKIRFGIGVDQEKFNSGPDAQGAFLAQAQQNDMFSDWDSGYKFLVLNGMFTSSSQTAETPFHVGTGKTDTHYNYTEVSLDLPQKALVRTTITPEIHIIADLSKIIDGAHKLRFSDETEMTGGSNVDLITENLGGMFSVAHVHND